MALRAYERPQGSADSDLRYRSEQKNGALAWEQGPRMARFHLSVSFSHRRVGSSILASLSEAGGNERRKAVSKPLPPRSSPVLIRYRKRANACSSCTPCANALDLLLRP